MRAQRVEPALLLEPAHDPANALEGLERLCRRVHVGRLRVVDEAHAAPFRHHLRAVRQARIVVQPRLDRPRAQAQRPRRTPGAGGVLVIVLPRQPGDAAQVDRGHLPPLAMLRKPALRRRDLPARALRPGAAHADHPVVGRPLGQLPREERALRLVHADDRAVGPALGEEAALGREIAAGARVAIQVVGREVRQHRHVGGQRARKLGLVGRQLQHDHVALLRGVEIQHPASDIARQMRPAPRPGQHVVQQRRGRGLAVRAGDRDHLRRGPVMAQGAEEQAHVVVHRHAGRVGGGDGRMRRGIEMRDAGARDQTVDILQRARAGEVAQREAFRLGRLAPTGPVVPGQHRRAPGPQRPRRREARTAQAEHGDRRPFESADRDHAQPSSQTSPWSVGAQSPAQRRRMRAVRRARAAGSSPKAAGAMRRATRVANSNSSRSAGALP